MNTETAEVATKTKMGRKAATIQWPEGAFTAKRLMDATGYSRVTVYNGIKAALASNIIRFSGTESSGKGAPNKVYMRN